jgi:hypothetical protein
MDDRTGVFAARAPLKALFCNRMVRTQIQLTDDQAKALRALSAARQVPMAELIRRSVDSLLQRESGASREAILNRARAVAGRFASGAADGSTDHDRHLADAFAAS